MIGVRELQAVLATKGGHISRYSIMLHYEGVILVPHHVGVLQPAAAPRTSVL